MQSSLTRCCRTLPLGLSGVALAQGGTMMNGGMGGAGWMGGYGGYWGPGRPRGLGRHARTQVTRAFPDAALGFTLRAEEVGAIDISGESMNPRHCAAEPARDLWRANPPF